MSPEERDAAVDDLIALICGLDHLLQGQSAADAAYFMRLCDRTFSPAEQHAIRETVLRAYRWQYIASGVSASAPDQAARRHGDAAADAENSLGGRADHRLLRSC